MAKRVSTVAREGLHALFERGTMGSWTDGQLVAQFVSNDEAREAAFRVLIHRHGPMVMGVCRRVLVDEHSAEDAFQATFLVLVKKAGSLRDCTLLTNWLYGVALRVANKERVEERGDVHRAPSGRTIDRNRFNRRPWRIATCDRRGDWPAAGTISNPVDSLSHRWLAT